ncbi:MAG: ribosome biogenesis GTPase YlqF [Clostridia bacterium]|nr:MAG: ribosome biogenesis GTPase YlqF [Clostridia bacterium]
MNGMDLGQWLRLVDVIIEVVDARLPATGRGVEVRHLLARSRRGHLLVLNKADLAEPEKTRAWMEHWRAGGLLSASASAVRGEGIRNCRRLVMEAAASRPKKWQRAPRAMVVGLPNVGKSSLLNRLIGRSVVRVGRRPGITRGVQWVRIAPGLELLDTPGLLGAGGVDGERRLRLSAVGILPQNEADSWETARWLLSLLPGERVDVYGAEMASPLATPEDRLAALARKRGFLGPGGIPDTSRAARLLVEDFSRGRLGPLTLELPGDGRGEAEDRERV